MWGEEREGGRNGCRWLEGEMREKIENRGSEKKEWSVLAGGRKKGVDRKGGVCVCVVGEGVCVCVVGGGV